MNPPPTDGGLIGDSERLIDLTKILNLENLNKDYKAIFVAVYPFVGDFLRLKELILQQQKICCTYGIDILFDYSAFEKMEVLAFYLASHSEASTTYCELKSQLFLEQNDFFDELMDNVESKMKSCTITKMEGLMRTVSRISSFYDALLC